MRDGGSLCEPEGRVTVWNTVMNEDRYLKKRWNDFVSARSSLGPARKLQIDLLAG
jgi:hypothetical protein